MPQSLLPHFGDVRNGRESGVLGRSGAGWEMEQNPYESPSDAPAPHAERPKWQTWLATVGWIAFFLLPAVGVIAAHTYPGPPFLDAPKGDTILSRVSLALGVPMQPLLFGSLLGCVVSVVYLPLTPPWKVAAIIAWFPLAVMQILALTLALILLGYPPVT
jgi:hypothetical protein